MSLDKMISLEITVVIRAEMLDLKIYSENQGGFKDGCSTRANKRVPHRTFEMLE